MLNKIFKAYDIRGIYPEQLDESAAWKIGAAAGRFLKQASDGRPGEIVVSRDMRKSSVSLTAALIDGLTGAQMDVVDLGMCDTSMVYFAINHLGAAGGIQTTASHNPPKYNGFKISGAGAVPIGERTGLEKIRTITEELDGPAGGSAGGRVRQLDLWKPYRDHILRFFKPAEPPGRSLKVFVDASNGMAGVMVPRVFDDLESVRIIPLNFETDGTFAHEPNPLVAANMVPTQEGVAAHAANLGACFDGDADRCMLTDENGAIVGCDHLTALLVGHMLEHADPAAPQPIPGALSGSRSIVYDLRSSKVVEQAIRACDATPVRSRVGHVFMKSALRESRGVFGGELSGHFYYRDNFCADSGAITLATVLWLLGRSDKTMSALIEH